MASQMMNNQINNEMDAIETEVEATVASPPGTRRRAALHARRTQDGRVVLGFKARRSWPAWSARRSATP